MRVEPACLRGCRNRYIPHEWRDAPSRRTVSRRIFADEVIPLLEEVVHLQEEAYKTQWAIYADVAKAYAQLCDYRQQRLALQSEVVAREMQLRHLLGMPPEDGWNVIPSTPPMTVRIASSRLNSHRVLGSNQFRTRFGSNKRIRKLARH